MQESEQQSRVIAFLRCVLPLLVICLHIPRTEQQLCLSRPASFLCFFVSELGGIAVPCFFIFSGYFFFSRLQDWDWRIWLEKIKQRISTLLIPYLLWNIIWIINRFIVDSVKSHQLVNIINLMQSRGGLRAFYDMGFTYVPSYQNIFGMTIFEGHPVNFPLWFVRDLMILVMLAPLIYHFIKHTKQYGIILLYLFYLFDIRIPWTGFSMTSCFYFSLGAYFMISGKLFVDFFRRIRKPVYFIAPVMLIACMIMSSANEAVHTYLVRIFVPLGVIAVCNLSDALVQSEQVKVKENFVKSSFFIYAMHIMIVNPIYKTWNAVIVSTPFSDVLRVLFVPAVIWLSCYLTFCILKKFCPPVLGILTGNRGI